MKVMQDSITVANLTPGADAYAGYVGGNWPTFAAVKARFPHADHLSIAVNATEDAHCLDVEKGDAVPGEVPAWVKRQQAHGVSRPCIYASVSAMPPVLDALARAGITRAGVRLWSAHYGAGKHICGPASCKWPGVPAMDGTQWTDTAPGTGGAHIDESLLEDSFFPAPAPPPPPPAQKFGYLVPTDPLGVPFAVTSTDGKTWS